VVIPLGLVKPIPEDRLDIGTTEGMGDAYTPLDVCSVDINQLRSRFSPDDEPTVRLPPSCDGPSTPLTFSPVIETSYSNDFANAGTLHTPSSDLQTCFDLVHDVPPVVRVTIRHVPVSAEVTRLSLNDCHDPGTAEHRVEDSNTRSDSRSKEALRDEPSSEGRPVVKVPPSMNVSLAMVYAEAPTVETLRFDDSEDIETPQTLLYISSLVDP